MNVRYVRIVITFLMMLFSVDNKYAVIVTMHIDDIIEMISYMMTIREKNNTVHIRNINNSRILYNKYMQYYVNIDRKINTCDAFYSNGLVKKTIDNTNNTYEDLFENKIIYITHLRAIKNDDKISEYEAFNLTSEEGTDFIIKYLNYVTSISYPSHFNVIYTYEPSYYDRLYKQELVLNKTLENTIYDIAVKNHVINNMEYFINNKSHYDLYGKTYNIGFMFYGPPGTGKTSMVKILAKKYNLPIFILDLSILTCNSQIREFVVELENRLEYNQKYIILIEDIDNSCIFSDVESPKDDGISMDAVLNMIDGVKEAPNRVLIFTSNTYIVDKKPALFRPGRIDHIIKIDYCTHKQIIDIINCFRPEYVFNKKHKFRTNITAAELSLLLSNCTCMKQVYDFVLDKK